MTTQTTAPTKQQLRLPGQAAAPEGPVDLTAMFVMHHGYRRDLTAFRAAAGATPIDDRPTWRALHRRWQRFAMILHHHHSGEDAGLWPLLRERAAAAGDLEAVATLDAMEAEHEVIDPLLEACEADLAALGRAPDRDVRAAFEVRVTAAATTIDRHMAHEERDALALVQRHLTPDDWHAMEKEHFEKTASMAYIAYVVPWVLHGLPDGARQRLRAETGPAISLLHPLLRPRFARLERRAFRHLPSSAGQKSKRSR